MGRFAYDIQLGFLAFPLVALLLALPYALYQYRRFGAISIWKTFVVFTFILYCLCAVSLVVFPLPADRSSVVAIAQTPQLHPFHVIEQIREQTDLVLSDRSTWGPTLRSPVVYEAIFNVALTVPLGFYLRYLFRCRWWQALLIGFATTLLFETSQLTGLFGIYAHPYRLFDVDDLILNTTGAMIGFWMAIPIAWALPNMDEIDERSIERGTSRTTLPRRAVAMLVDLITFAASFTAVWLMASPSDAQIAKALAIDPSRADAKNFAFHFAGGILADPISALLIALLIGAVLFALIPSLTKGRTIGCAIVGLRAVRTDGQDASFALYWARFFVSAVFVLMPLLVCLLAPDQIEGISNKMLYQMIGLVALVWILTIIVRAIGVFVGQDYVSLSDLASGTRLVPSKQAAGNTALKRATRATSREEEGRRANPSQENEAQGNATRDGRQAVDDHGKQAALESLESVNYYDQHPLGEPELDPDRTQVITDPEAKRKIKRDQRPDAGQTQVFKR